MALSAREKVQEVFRLLRSTVPSICLQGLVELKKNLDKSESASVFIEQGVLEVLYNVSKSDRKVIVDYCLSCLGHITSSPRHVFLNSLKEEEWGSRLIENFYRFSWEARDEPILFRFCRVVGNLAKVLPSTSRFFQRNLNDIAEFVLKFSRKEDTIVVALRAIRYMANSMVNVKVLSKGTLIQTIVQHLVKNTNPIINYHLVMTIHTIFSYLRYFSKDVEKWIGPHLNIIQSLVNLRRDSNFDVCTQSLDILNHIVRNRPMRSYCATPQTFETLIPIVKEEINDNNNNDKFPYLLIMLAFCRANPHSFSVTKQLNLLVCTLKCLDRLNKSNPNYGSLLDNTINTIQHFQSHGQALGSLVEGGLIPALMEMICERNGMSNDIPDNNKLINWRSDVAAGLLLKISWLEAVPTELLKEEYLLALIAQLILRNDEGTKMSKILNRIVSQETFFSRLISMAFPATIYSRIIHPNKKQNNQLASIGRALLDKMSSFVPKFGLGEIKRLLFKKEEPVRSAVALSATFLITSKQLLINIEKEFKIFDRIRKMLQNPKTRKEAFFSLVFVGDTLDLKKFLMLPSAQLETVCDGNHPCKLTEYKDVIFLTSSGEIVMATKETLRKSPYFTALLFGGFGETDSKFIYLPEVENRMLKIVLHLASGCGSMCSTCKGIEDVVKFDDKRSELLSILDRFLLHDAMEGVSSIIANSDWISPISFLGFFKSLDKSFPTVPKYLNHLKFFLFSGYVEADFSLAVFEASTLTHDEENDLTVLSDIFELF